MKNRHKMQNSVTRSLVVKYSKLEDNHKIRIQIRTTVCTYISGWYMVVVRVTEPGEVGDDGLVVPLVLLLLLLLQADPQHTRRQTPSRVDIWNIYIYLVVLYNRDTVEGKQNRLKTLSKIVFLKLCFHVF